MGEITGSELLGKAFWNEGIKDFFFLMGGPMLETEAACIKAGMRGIDVRHEQAAAMMAHAYSRVTQKPSLCIAASGPGTTNLGTGLANAVIDCAPVIALGGSAHVARYGHQVFQEFDQLAMMKTCTKHAERIYTAARIPEIVSNAVHRATSGKPGPVYLDLPRDTLDAKVDEASIDWSLSGRRVRARPAADPAQVEALIEAMAKAKQPVILSGSGVIWSQAWDELRGFVEDTGAPYYATPQGRGVLPDDHKLTFPSVRTAAFREADLIIIVGTRQNFIIGHAAPPRFSAGARLARIDVDADEIATAPRKIDFPLIGDCKAVLQQLRAAAKGRIRPARFEAWRKTLSDGEAAKRAKPGANKPNDTVPIHPQRLCEEVRDIMPRDAILCVDGQEILNFGRLVLNTYHPGHRLNSGPFGIMGVGLPFGIGAKAAAPDKPVIVVHGDGSFGFNGMEIDTAVRHKLPLLLVISNNGGWTGDPTHTKPGRNLAFSRYDKMGEAFGAYGEHVEKPADIKPALERALKQVEAGRVAVVNVITDDRISFRRRAGDDFNT